ncbi:TetR family transcriptional regulator [Acidiferrimicrobium sp. IK]|uniref:TetR family transcriptional regulator n=1 Tax=Acidiferrimicrobium sp. IK TaxID=2871700 RepID=UPI0021CB87E2|nr:TetR family transcriptional regulator [Acidiferrimicrobium sp. IK]MCU4186666.1 TetR family transcriptional regulator [Acidiferrimicrobium sp. IK]
MTDTQIDTAATVQETSRRTSKKSETRHALVDAALELFGQRGYDNTTTVDIAEAAGVSPRTFFRYFATKESVLFFGRVDFVETLTALLRAQPQGMSDLEAMETSFLAAAPGIERVRQPTARYRQIIASSPLLRGREQEELDKNIAGVAAAIAHRHGRTTPTDAQRLLARIGLDVLEHAMARWLATSRRRLGTDIKAAVGQLRSLADVDI